MTTSMSGLRRNHIRAHASHIAQLEQRLKLLRNSELAGSVGLLSIAFESHKRNIELYRAAGFKISSGSEMFDNGRIGIVFSAAALESAVSTVLAIVCMSAKPRIQRALLMEGISMLRNPEVIRSLRKCFPNMPIFDRPQLQNLFETRNAIIHARPNYHEDYVAGVAAKKPRFIVKWTRFIRGPSLEDTNWITDLPLYLDLSVEILEKLIMNLRKRPITGLPNVRRDHPLREKGRKKQEKAGKTDTVPV